WLEDESWQDMADDVVAIVVGISLLWLVITESWRNRQELETWRQQAHQLSPGVSAGDPETLDAARSYAQAVEAQFATWGLSAGEHDVAVALLKGMSFQEIAAIRETREKTVRQQASSIYRKSGLSGRHELAAWFFEDLLSQAD
ncbi:MAG: helix-turn-helix transcriptional regulator, partial [Granulosicoccaceae bacterium]